MKYTGGKSHEEVRKGLASPAEYDSVRPVRRLPVMASGVHQMWTEVLDPR